MAWENLRQLLLNNVAYTLPGLSSTGINQVVNNSSGSVYQSGDNQVIETDASGFFKLISNSDISNYTTDDYYFNNGAYLRVRNFGSTYTDLNVYFYTSTNVNRFYCQNGTGTNRFPVYYGIIINHETQRAIMWCSNQKAQGFGDDFCLRVMSDKSDAWQAELYNAVMGSQPVLYQWSSVPAISGKNGILSLPVLIDTDGNPVSNGSASDFSTLPDSVKVRTLADLAVQ